MTTTYINLNGKQYAVRQRADGGTDIYAQWDAFNIADRHFVRSSPIPRAAYVNPNGRIGRKVMAAMQQPMRERICTPIRIDQAGALLA